MKNREFNLNIDITEELTVNVKGIIAWGDTSEKDNLGVPIEPDEDNSIEYTEVKIIIGDIMDWMYEIENQSKSWQDWLNRYVFEKLNE